MNENENKRIDNLSRKVIVKASVESPSFDFTAQIMTQLTALGQSQATVYKPLISKKAWFVIFGTFAALLAYAFFGTQQQASEPFLDFSILDKTKVLYTLPRFTFSKTLSYALLFLSLMVLIQVSFLKDYFDRKFERE